VSNADGSVGDERRGGEIRVGAFEGRRRRESRVGPVVAVSYRRQINGGGDWWRCNADRRRRIGWEKGGLMVRRWGDGGGGESTSCGHPSTEGVADRRERRRRVAWYIHVQWIDLERSVHAGKRWLVAIRCHHTLTKGPWNSYDGRSSVELGCITC
jgi:hypothetical protein